MARKKIGCKNCYYARQKKDSDGNIIFEIPKRILGLEMFNYTRAYGDGSNYADDIQNIYTKKLTAIDVDLDFTEISLKIKSELQGKEYKAGMSASGTNDQSKEVALLFEETYNDGTSERVVFYNVKLYEKDAANKTATDNIEFTAQGLSGRALSFTNNEIEEKIEFRIDSGDETYDKEVFKTFFNKVQYFPNNSNLKIEENKQNNG